MLWKKTIRSPKTGNLSDIKKDPSESELAVARRGNRGANFVFAIHYIKNGKRLMRIGWNEEDSYLYMENGLLLHNRPFHKNQKKVDKKGYPYVASEDDIFGDDWVIV